ncbi:AraC family transcriptional regulator [Nitzschia inconspicua]|uniref:AraC family transcriptional regulator n=1 Tax=Nitzschia inconspicua TaxID=303405 RepID=A0A9K3LH36_9STRA|nr:AraC family transcriptional regulator [Nitzschia inconspicua]
MLLSKAAAFLALVSSSTLVVVVHAQTKTLALSSATVHWGYFSKLESPVLTVESGEEVIVEMATHHACDDYDKMILGDPGMEDIFLWGDKDMINEPYRGATGSGDGVHILTGPIYINGAEPGDILKVEILELAPRKNPVTGKTYGSNAAAWWGFQARTPKADGTPHTAGSFTDTPNSNDEAITIYEIVEDDGTGNSYAIPSYQFMWPKITDPDGVTRDYIAYPGTCVPHDEHGDTVPSSDIADRGWTKAAPITYFDNPYPAKIPLNYHIGCMGLPPASHDFVDSIPPMVTGGNIDNQRIRAGTTMYYPIEVEGALLSMGDAHAAQGDSELNGTGIETSITAKVRVTVIKADSFNEWQSELDFPLGETEDEWIVHGFTETDYLQTFFEDPSAIYGASSIDKAMSNAFIQTRKFVMAAYGLTEMEAVSIITQGIDFGMTQVVDGNWGVHAIVPKAIFASEPGTDAEPSQRRKLQAMEEAETHIALSNETVHWGYFSKSLEPIVTIESGTEITVEMATHHACDDWDKMIKGDEGMESIYLWNEDGANQDYRGASGTGDGVHILTGPIFVEGAEPGDILKVEILDLKPRVNPEGRAFGSNAAAWWGFQARVNKTDDTAFTAGDFTGTPDSNDEFITIYEIIEVDGQSYVIPSYQFEWPVIEDPQGNVRNFIAYPGTCVPHDPHGDTIPSSVVSDHGWSKTGDIVYYDNPFQAKIPINYHVGCMGLPPASHEFVDSIPPMVTGGNLDNKRIGIGTTMYYPVQVAGALLSMGDAHAAQGDSELDGTGIETSITGRFKISVIKAADFNDWQKELDFPLGETDTEWIVHGFTETDYLATYAEDPSAIYSASSVDLAMRNAYTQTRKFMMAMYGMSEIEANTFITQGINFGMTQLVDGNWGVHGIIPKAIFEVDGETTGGGGTTAPPESDGGYYLGSVSLSAVVAALAAMMLL